MNDDSVVGSKIDEYRIQEVLGRGGMGVVYKARDVALSRDVALKRIDPSLANDDVFLNRFRSEARALARIDSPYIVTIYALRQTEIGLLIVMEYVDGGTLKDRIGKGPMSWSEARPIVAQMLKALEHAHGAEVIHRDVKPRNVMLDRDGTVKVTDFGLAKMHRPNSDETVTQGVYGTIDYMSPEQVQGGKNVGPRSDLYSTGMTIYELLTGELPFDVQGSEFTKMRKIVEEEFPPPDRLHPKVPNELSPLILKALEKNPDDRFRSARVMREAFEAFAERHSKKSTTPTAPPQESAGRRSSPSGNSFWKAVGVLVLVAIVSVIGYLLIRELIQEDEPQLVRTELSVSSDPSRAEVLLDGTRIGTTPLEKEIKAEGKAENAVRVRVQRAGYAPVDTMLQLGDRRTIDLRTRLSLKPTPLTIRTDPPRAEVYVDNRRIGSTPVKNYLVEKRRAHVRIERENYRSVDTLIATARLDHARLNLQLDRSSPPPPSYGRLEIDVIPSGRILVDDEVRNSGTSLQVRTGSHKIRFEHPRYGSKDTTLTIEEGESHALTCHFEHRVVVRTDGAWANVYLNGENTGQPTTHDTTLGTGQDYQIGAHIQSRQSFTVTGGTYSRIVGGDVREERERFSGNSVQVGLQPSFRQMRHVVDFQVSESDL